MSPFFNQYSFLIFTALAGMIVLIGLRYRRVSWRWIVAAEAGIAISALALFSVLNPTGDNLRSTADIRATLQNGKPTLLQFFSHYCTGCLVTEPAVDALVAQISGEFNILRLDIHSEVGRAAREVWGFSYTPEFIVFDQNGIELWRAHSVPPADILAQAQSS
jgi:thiol-disulfide isomerase/thioredoxin